MDAPMSRDADTMPLLVAAHEAERDRAEGEAFRRVLAGVVENAGLGVVSGHCGVEMSALGKALRGQGGRHVPAHILPALVRRFDRDRRIVRSIADAGGCGIVELDLRTDAERLRDLERAIAERLGSSPVRDEILAAAKLSREGA